MGFPNQMIHGAKTDERLVGMAKCFLELFVNMCKYFEAGLCGKSSQFTVVPGIADLVPSQRIPLESFVVKVRSVLRVALRCD